MAGLSAGWFRHLTIGQKLLVSFGLILTVLLLSFTTLLLYLPDSRTPERRRVACRR